MWCYYSELRTKNKYSQKDRDSPNTEKVPVSGYSLCRCEGTLSDLMAGKAEYLKQLNVENDITPEGSRFQTLITLGKSK